MGTWNGPEDQRNMGRPKGARNKTTNRIREAYQNLVEMNRTDETFMHGR